MNELKYILGTESTRCAELLLGTIKVMLGLSLLLYLVDPPRYGVGLSTDAAVDIGLLLLLVGVAQLVGVLGQIAFLRQAAVVLATVVWIGFIGSVWLSTGSVRPVIVYLPLVAINAIVSRRVSRLERGGGGSGGGGKPKAGNSG